jgi:hypothetical protein
MLDKCSVCPKPLLIPIKSLYTCEHCRMTMCQPCIIKHGRELTHTNVHIPHLMRTQ